MKGLPWTVTSKKLSCKHVPNLAQRECGGFFKFGYNSAVERLILSCILSPFNSLASAVPKSINHERMEPSTWQSQDAWRSHVLVCHHSGGPACQHHCIHSRILPQSVSGVRSLRFVFCLSLCNIPRRLRVSSNL